LKIENFISFVRDTFNSKDFIPLHAPTFVGKEKEFLNDCIESTFVSSVGKYVDLSEEMVSKIIGVNKSVAVVNGTAGLQVALKLAGVKPNDEVITQALTFVATANAIAYNYATPIFLDVDIDTMGLSPKAVEQFLEAHGEIREDGCYNKLTNKKIAACLPMHTFGFPIHLNEMIIVCEKWNIPLVEDAAESLGSLYQNKPTGSFGSLGVFSFNGNKIITSGGGGMIVSKNEELGSQAKHLTTTAKIPHPYEYNHDQLGYNFRMPNINAALLCAQLEQLDAFIEKKRLLAIEYSKFFNKSDVIFREELPNTRANYWLMCIELQNKSDRKFFLEESNAKGVMTRPIWKLMHRLPMYQNCFRDSQTNAEYLESTIVNIPSSVIL